MANEQRRDDMNELWRNQNAEPFQTSVEDIRRKAHAHQRRVSRRNLREYAAGVLVVVFFGWCMWQFPFTLLRVVWGLLVTGTVYVMVQLHRRGAATSSAVPLTASCLDYHRRELERQRDLLRNVWPWYLAPLVPGLAVISAASALGNTAHMKHAVLIVLCYDAVVALAFWQIWKLNRRAADKLQRQIDELDAIEKRMR